VSISQVNQVVQTKKRVEMKAVTFIYMYVSFVFIEPFMAMQCQSAKKSGKRKKKKKKNSVSLSEKEVMCTQGVEPTTSPPSTQRGTCCTITTCMGRVKQRIQRYVFVVQILFDIHTQIIFLN